MKKVSVKLPEDLLYQSDTHQLYKSDPTGTASTKKDNSTKKASNVKSYFKGGLTP